MRWKNRKWIPLQSALAWMVTRDVDLCERLLDGPHETIAAISLAEQEVLSSGCFKPKDQYFADTDPGVWVASSTAATSTTIVRRLPSSVAHYVGRFDDLAKDYEQASANADAFINRLERVPHNPESTAGILHFQDYLTWRWSEAFGELRDGLSEGDFAARGTRFRCVRPRQTRCLSALGTYCSDCQEGSGKIPVDRVTCKWTLGWNGQVLEDHSWGDYSEPACWTDVTIQFLDLKKKFPTHKPPTVNQLKRAAVNQAIQELGVETLAALGQKEREEQIIEQAMQDNRLTERKVKRPSVRFVRDRWREAKEKSRL